MLIQSYGLFWDRDKVDWNPGGGNQRLMLGRRNSKQPALRLADVWNQKGLYVLYSNTGPYYVGIAEKLGKRLHDHTKDNHRRNWVRFSWFGFHPLTDQSHKLNLPDPGIKPGAASVDVLIGDMEALLIKSMGTFNIRNMNFRSAKQWEQVGYQEAVEWGRRARLTEGKV